MVTSDVGINWMRGAKKEEVVRGPLIGGHFRKVTQYITSVKDERGEQEGDGKE